MKHYVVAIATVAAIGLAGCHSVQTAHNLCGGTEACPKAPCDPIDILYGRPNRPFQPLGVVQVRVDRGTMFSNPTLKDAIPPLENEARAMGADAIILTHEEFLTWYDKGEDVSPIHDLERQESWYITEKGRYLSGLAVVYTGPAKPVSAPAAPCAPPQGPPMMGPPTGAVAGGNGERVMYTVIVPPNGQAPVAAPNPPAPPPPAPEQAPAVQQYPPTPISIERAPSRTLPPPRHLP